MTKYCHICEEQHDHKDLCPRYKVVDMPGYDLGKHDPVEVSVWERMRYKIGLMGMAQ